MNKVFVFLLFFFILQSKIIADEYQPYIKDQIVEKSVSLGKGKYNIPLPPGKFTVVVTHEKRTKGAGTKMYYLTLLKLTKDNIMDEAVSITISRPTTTYWLPIKSCKRTNYYFIKTYLKGKAQSCWIVNHRTFNFSGNIKKNSFAGKTRDFIIKNKIKNPNVGLYSHHFYTSPRHKNVFFEIAYIINPELRGVSPDKSKSWKESEYLKTRISNFPEKKSFIDSYVKKSAKYQRDLEIGINMLKEHRLNTLN